MVEESTKFFVKDCHREHGNYFNKFIKYFKNEWRTVDTPKGFTIYRKFYHRLIAKLIRKKPRLVMLLKKLKEV
ncbi:hypothetical protein TSAR_009515 [Trichomalopsis sarcophagae]|uniref:Uncharacterized protein n=1 Tax=Trichomalopsis sarcophagae TaxID=543379 RepID=A0A232EWS4_9HYME|nr:hypothetical protein TSAR_009515 [Trichomalopsis sarcophagae]